MPTYQMPKIPRVVKTRKNEVLLVANGDLRLSANQKCWAAQAEMEAQLSDAVSASGHKLVRAHQYNPATKHGFISSQREGMEVFSQIDPAAPLIVAEAVWQYSHHLLHGLDQPSRPLVDGSQLVRDMARVGGHAESQRITDEGWPEVFDALERRFRRARVPQEIGPMAVQRPGTASDLPRHALRQSESRRLRMQIGRHAGRTIATREGHYGCL